MHNTTLYNTWFLFNLHICQACGSFQCPFCRYYNSGPPGALPLGGGAVSVLLALLAMLVTQSLTARTHTLL